MPDPNPSPDFETFVTHVLKGARFEGHAMPVTVLPELAAYRELVLDIARSLFFREHPERQRVPKGFDDGIDLVLRGIGAGSTTTVLERRSKVPIADAAQLSLIPSKMTETCVSKPDHFEQARDLVNEMIEAVRTRRPVPSNFPPHAIRLFNSFGRSLQDDESIEIRDVTGRAVATYDRHVRKRVVLLRETTYEDVVEIIGKVTQYDSQRETFGALVDDRTIPAPLAGLDEDQLRIVRTAAVHMEDLRVRVCGTGAFDQDDKLVRFVGITELAFSEDEDLRAKLDPEKRLAVLADLSAGWLDGEGAALPRARLEWLATVLEKAEAQGLARPYLYPTPEGGVQAEWSFLDAEVTALFALGDDSVSCVGVQIKSGAHLDEDLDLGVEGNLAKLAGFIARFSP